MGHFINPYFVYLFRSALFLIAIFYMFQNCVCLGKVWKLDCWGGVFIHIYKVASKLFNIIWWYKVSLGVSDRRGAQSSVDRFREGRRGDVACAANSIHRISSKLHLQTDFKKIMKFTVWEENKKITPEIECLCIFLCCFARILTFCVGKWKKKNQLSS